MIDATTKGVFAIAPTPFLPDGGLDVASLARMTAFYLARGVDGITILGILGEAQKLDLAESLTVVREVIGAAEGRPIVVGVSAPGFNAMERLAKEAMAAGAAGVMLTPPTGTRTDEQITGWFGQVIPRLGADVPFVLQDHPTVTGVLMSTAVIRRIVEDYPSCVMLKHEDWPGLEKISTIRRWQRSGELRPLSILCGNGGLFLDCELQRGADGAMTGYAFPELLRRLVDLAATDRDAAQDLFDAHLPLLRYEHQSGVGLAVRKYVLARRGAIAHPTLRAPGATLTAAAQAEVAYLLARLAVRDPAAA